VFSWGSGKNGRLGYSVSDQQLLPKKVEIKDRIVKVSCGDWHAAALSGKTSRLYCL
jgi:hypothetical protein